MNPLLIKLLRNRLSLRSCSVVGIVNDDLTSSIEKLPYELLASIRYHFPQLERLWALLACMDWKKDVSPARSRAQVRDCP